MAIRNRDRAVHLDALTMLAEFGGNAARDLESHHRAILDDENIARKPSDTADSASRILLRQQCDERMDASLASLSDLASSVPSNVLLGVPFLLGQADVDRAVVGPGPNQFDFEIELLSSSASGGLDEPGVENVRAALNCLRVARSIRIMSQTALMTRGDDNPLGASLSTAWLFERGRFSGLYDLEIVEKFAARLRSRGVPADSPAPLRKLLEIFVRSWGKAFNEFFSDCRSQSTTLVNWLSSPELLGQPVWSGQDLGLIAKHCSRVWLSEDQLPSDEPTARWMQHISTSLPLPPIDPHPFALSRLVSRPLVKAGEASLLVLAHRFDTDLSDLTNAIWGESFGETYHAVRGAVVEDVAFDTLMRLPGARGIKGGHYASSTGQIQGESDGLVIWERMVFLIEAKGGFMSLAARRGNLEAAVADVKGSVGEAYYQAARLLLLIERENCVELTNDAGDTFVARRGDIDQAHVIIPTADDFGNVGILLDAMAEANILPKGGAPLVAAGQELLLFYDLFADPLDFAAYLLFREELLTYRPAIRVVDEHEIAGGYVAGVDFIAVAERHLKAIGTGIENLVPDPVLQRHIDDWLQKRYLNLDADVPPPTRHRADVIRMAHDLYNDAKDMSGALSVLQAGRDAARRASLRVAPRASRQPFFSLHPEIAVVTAATAVPSYILRRQREWASARRCRQVWVFKRDASGVPNLTAAMKVSGPQGRRTSLLRTVALDELEHWYRRVDAKRRRGFDETVITALEREGLAPSTAIGVSRLGIVEKVRASASLGVPIAKVAALWMGELKEFASQRGVPLAQLEIKPAHVAEVIELTAIRRLPRAALRGALENAIDMGRSPIEYSNSLGHRRLSVDELEALIGRVLSQERAAAQRAERGDLKAVSFLAGLVMKSSPDPKPEYGRVVSTVQELLSAGVQDSAETT